VRGDLQILVVLLGALGISLELAGVHSVIRGIAIVAFLGLAPGLSFLDLVSPRDRLASMVLAAAAAAVLLTLIATVLLASGLWSSTTGVIVTAVIVGGFQLARFWLGATALGRARRRVD
jgi:hypothetical protein